MFAALHGEGGLARLAGEFSPYVECCDAATVVFDASGLDRLFGPPHAVAAAIARRARERGMRANLALAATPDAALLAARGFTGVSLIPHGDEGKFLGSLPVALLNPSEELAATLVHWGIRRLRELAALPPLGIAERLGPEGLRLHELANGGWPRKLVTVEEEPRYEDALDLDYPVEEMEPLAFVLARLVNGLCTLLVTRGLATDELRLSLKLEDGTAHERTLRLPVPALDAKAFLKLLQLDLTSCPPAAPVVRVWLGVNPVKPRAAQGGLFVPVAPEPVKLELTVARIEALVGAGNVGSPRVEDTHRPDAFQMVKFNPEGADAAPPPVTADEARLALRRFRPPRAARVVLAEGQPERVEAGSIRGRVVAMAGPWRSSGEWWTAAAWARDEWDVALSDGALYRLFRSPEGWFVEGCYD